MPDLIDELEQDHREILTHLVRIRLADYRHDVIQVELRLAKERFLQHIGRDALAVLDPMMADPDRSGLARRFHRHMQALTRDVLGFFDRFLQPADQNYGIEFAMELGRVTQRLRYRMEAEEAHLYPQVRRPHPAVFA